MRLDLTCNVLRKTKVISSGRGGARLRHGKMNVSQVY